MPSRWRIRPLIRTLHRDIGYCAVGLTAVYALSGLAVNHVADWEPNFREIHQSYQLAPPLPETDEALTQTLLQTLHVAEPVRETYG